MMSRARGCLSLQCAVLLAACAAAVAESAAEPLLLRVENELTDGKKQLMRSVLSRELENRDALSVKPAFTWELGTIKGSAALTFRSFNQSFILAGKVLHRLVDGPEQGSFGTKPVAEFQEFLGEVAFIESVEWDGILYLLAAYREGLLQLFTVSSENHITLRQSINCYGVPTDAEFFMQDEKLFLVVVAQDGSSLVPVVVYRWHGTQLDEEGKHLEIQATAVSTFPFQESVIIVVAVGRATNREAGLVVLQHSGGEIKVIQVLAISEPAALQHYTFRSENFLLVTTYNGLSVTCWWAGTELIVMESLKHTQKVHSIGVGYVRGETLLILAESSKITIYRPTDRALQFVDSHEFSATVQSASLYTTDDSVSLLAITESNGVLTPYVLQLQITFQPLSVAHYVLNRHPLLQCFSNLQSSVESRQLNLKDILSRRKHLLHRSSAGRFTGKLIVKKLVPNSVDFRIIKSAEPSVAPVMSASDLRNGIAQSVLSMKELLSGFKNIVLKSSHSSSIGGLTADELWIKNTSMDSVAISNLNGVTFDLKNLLRHSKDQKLIGKITTGTVLSDTLTVGSLNNIRINELLLQSVKTQVVKGLEYVTNVHAKKIVISSQSPVNGILLKQIVFSREPSKVISVAGVKTFSDLDLQHLAVNLMNNVEFNHWVKSLLPPVPALKAPSWPAPNSGVNNLNFPANSVIQNLTVHGSINGVQIDNLLSSLFLKGLRQNIAGHVTYSKLHVRNLVASDVNGVHTSSLLTSSTDQIITGSLSVNGIKAPDLHSENINGLKFSQDVAFVDSDLPVTTPVVFKDLRAHEVVLPPIVNIAGSPVDISLLNQPKTVYERKVTVVGTLKLMDVQLEHSDVFLNGTGLDLENLNQRYWTIGSEQVLNNSVYLPDGLSVISLGVNTINGYRPNSFVDSALTKELKGTWHFSHATIVGNLNHQKNATQFPVSPKELFANVIRTSGNYQVSGKKEFVNALETNHLVSKFINDINVQNQLKQKTPDTRTFEEIWIGGDLVVDSDLVVGSVNSINLCDRLSKALLVDKPGHISSTTISAVSASNIDVTTINGLLFDAIAVKNETIIPRFRKITIMGDVHVPALSNVMRVNNKNLTQDYLSRVVDRTQNGRIYGKKTFASQLNVERNFYSLDYNGIQLKQLFDRVLSKKRDQLIPARIGMKQFVAKELKATTINNIAISDILTSDSMSRQTVEGDLIFTNDLDVSANLNTKTFQNSCDLKLVAEKLNRVDAREWESFTVKGNLEWNNSLPIPSLGLSYYLDSAVTKNDEQSIIGEVFFVNTISVDNFNTKKDINDISIIGILSDSLRTSLPHQVIFGHKVFSKILYSSSMNVSGNVAAENIAGINILAFNRSLVRVGGDQEVTGKKNFLQGFSADLLRIEGSVNGLITADIVTYNMPKVPCLTLEGPLHVYSNLNFETMNSRSLEKLLQERVTLDGLQHIRGHITFTRDLRVVGDMLAPRINNVDISDIVLRDTALEQDITGRKQFAQGLRVEGPLEVYELDNVVLQSAYQAALFVNENATILGDLVFNDIVTMDANLNVATTVNNFLMDELATRLRTLTPRRLDQVRDIARTINITKLLIEARGDLSVMCYLERVHNVSISFTNTHRAVAVNIGEGETYLNVYGWGNSSLCGLPSTCPCPTQYSVHVGPNDIHNATWKTGVQHKASERFFTFHLDQPHVSVIVKTNTVSSSTKCRKFGGDRLDEVTTLTWVDRNGQENNLGETILKTDPAPIWGYVSDVKVIAINNRVYVILGLGYNPDFDTTNANSVIVRLDMASQKARIVDEFPTQGVSALEIFYIEDVPHVVVGNSYDQSQDSTRVPLNIYRFDVAVEKMILVKSIATEGGVVSVSSMVQGGDSLIIVAQKQPYAPVMVLKHYSDDSHQDYHFAQQLNANSIPTGLGVFYVGEPGRSDAFLGISSADDQFHLYKFCHVEGFKLVMKMDLPGVQGFTSFSAGHKQFLLFTSNEAPSVFEIRKNGCSV